MCSKSRRLNMLLCILITAIVFIISGIILILLRGTIYDRAKSNLLTLKAGTKTFEMFRKLDFDIYFDIYFFNWTNPEEFNDLSKKPRVEEIGPFRFKEVMEKTDILIHENGTISYNRTRRWFFVRSQSAYDLSTPITTINPVAVSGAYSIRHESYFMRKGFSFSLRSIVGGLALTKSVGEMLFDGYEDPLINLAKSIPFIKKKLPPFDKFGWFYGRNNSHSFDGRFNIGTKSPGDFGQIYEWNNWHQTPYYEGGCGRVWGSAGEFFPQDLPANECLQIFNIEMCRTVEMDFQGEETVDMLKGYKYVIGDHFLDNGTIVPENKCFCMGECVPYGAVNISSCRYGSPGFVSLPHFHKADPYYHSLIDGMEPSSKHNFFAIVEPVTGMALEVQAKLQLNLMVKPVGGLSLFENINEVFFPVLWFEQSVKVPRIYTFGLLILLWFREICLLGGLFMIAIGTYLVYYTFHKICTTNLFGRENKKIHLMKELVPLNQMKLS